METHLVHPLPRKKLNKELCLSYKKTNACSICGYDSSTASLDFHHVQNKETGIAKLINNHTWKSVDDIHQLAKIELAKCTVVCSNCHKQLHFDIDRYKKYEKQIVEKSFSLQEKKRCNVHKIISLFHEGYNRFDIAKIADCSPCRVFELLKTNNLI